VRNIQTYIFSAAALGGLLVAGSLLHSRGSRAQGAYASPVSVTNTTANPVPASPAMPANPFFQEITNNISSGSLQAVGPGSGAFAITSLTMTNFGGVGQSIRVFQPVLSGGSPGSCIGTSIVGGGQGIRVEVQPNSSIHLAFPAPIVINASNGQTCAGVTFENTNGTNYVNFVGYSY